MRLMLHYFGRSKKPFSPWKKDCFEVGRLSDVSWSPQYHNLKHAELFLWKYLKKRVYSGKHRILDDFKEAIQREVELITAKILLRV